MRLRYLSWIQTTAKSTGNIPAPSATGASPADLLTDYSRKYREQFLPVNAGGH